MLILFIIVLSVNPHLGRRVIDLVLLKLNATVVSLHDLCFLIHLNTHYNEIAHINCLLHAGPFTEA